LHFRFSIKPLEKKVPIRLSPFKDVKMGKVSQEMQGRLELEEYDEDYDDNYEYMNKLFT